MSGIKVGVMRPKNRTPYVKIEGFLNFGGPAGGSALERASPPTGRGKFPEKKFIVFLGKGGGTLAVALSCVVVRHAMGCESQLKKRWLSY